MSDTPTPPEASGDTPTPDVASSTPRRKRPWTLLGRLSKAVREQNWFAVVLELAIVVLGVVIGFQVTAWGQARADRVQEEHYLRQLAEDLRQTEDTFETRRGEWSLRDSSVTALVRSFRTARLPTADSVLIWTGRAVIMRRPSIVTATADALVSTGDINLIRNDSLRSRITYFVDQMDIERSHLEHIDEEARPLILSLTEHVDFIEGWFVGVSPAQRDTLALRWRNLPVPGGALRTVRALDVEALVRDPAAYTAVSNLWRLMFYEEANRERILVTTIALREQVEAELNP